MMGDDMLPAEWFTVFPKNVIPIEWARVLRMQKLMQDIEEQVQKMCGFPDQPC